MSPRTGIKDKGGRKIKSPEVSLDDLPRITRTPKTKRDSSGKYPCPHVDEITKIKCGLKYEKWENVWRHLVEKHEGGTPYEKQKVKERRDKWRKKRAGTQNSVSHFYVQCTFKDCFTIFPLATFVGNSRE